MTGATSGIGYVTARELARAGASVVAVGRDPQRTTDTVRQIVQESGSPHVRGMLADLFLQHDVRRLASELLRDFPRVHVLVNNAGAIFSRRSLTAEGMERTWALNVVTPFLLSRLLLPRLTASAPARVINVSSAAHQGVHLDFENLQGERRYSGFTVYSRSKLALVLLTYEFARRNPAPEVTVNALHPGFVATRFGHNNPGGLGVLIRVLSFLFGMRPERGARTSVFLAAEPSIHDVTGKYFDHCRIVASSPESYDATAGQRLWDVLAVQTGLPPDPPFSGAP
ncbi:MAG: SDR family oxidoreductase [Thermoplasmata archaeon]|nr:SDR family oxidoreductase [Thermoplasmata archaeon]